MTLNESFSPINQTIPWEHIGYSLLNKSQVKIYGDSTLRQQQQQQQIQKLTMKRKATSKIIETTTAAAAAVGSKATKTSLTNTPHQLETFLAAPIVLNQHQPLSHFDNTSTFNAARSRTIVPANPQWRHNKGPVIYWMSRDQRVQDNWALIKASNIAMEHQRPLGIIFCLSPTFLGATIRQYGFMLRGLKLMQSEAVIVIFINFA